MATVTFADGQQERYDNATGDVLMKAVFIPMGDDRTTLLEFQTVLTRSFGLIESVDHSRDAKSLPQFHVAIPKQGLQQAAQSKAVVAIVVSAVEVPAPAVLGTTIFRLDAGHRLNGGAVLA